MANTHTSPAAHPEPYANPHPVIGLIGLARSGKNTVANILCEAASYRQIAIADPLREAALALDPLIPEPYTPGKHSRLTEIITAMGWEHAKDHYPEVRRTLQRLGTEAGWQIHGENLWIDRTLKTINADPNTPFIITDVRFAAEVTALRRITDRPVQLWQVTRRGKTHNLDPMASAHPSEKLAQEADKYCDVTIRNDSSLDSLTAQVLTCAADLHSHVNQLNDAH